MKEYKECISVNKYYIAIIEGATRGYEKVLGGRGESSIIRYY